MLRNVLVALVFGNLVLMPFQIAGVSSALMYWNTDYAHDLNVLALEEIGTFKLIAVYPTLFLGADFIHFQIGQGRPSGISPANNLLTVFLTFAAVLFLHSPEMRRSWVASVLVNGCLVLTGSKFAILFAALIYLKGLLSLRRRVMSTAAIGLVTLASIFVIYLCLFPGVAEINFGKTAYLFSFGFRLLDILVSLGLPADFLEITNDQSLHDLRESTGGSPATIIGYITSGVGRTLLVIALIAALITNRKVGQLQDRTLRSMTRDLALWAGLSVIIFPAIIQSILFYSLCGVLLRAWTERGATETLAPSQAAMQKE